MKMVVVHRGKSCFDWNGKFNLIGDDEDLNSKVIHLLQDSITPYL